MKLAEGVDEQDVIMDQRDPNKMARRQKFLEERMYSGRDDVEIFEMLDDSD